MQFNDRPGMDRSHNNNKSIFLHSLIPKRYSYIIYIYIHDVIFVFVCFFFFSYQLVDDA